MYNKSDWKHIEIPLSEEAFANLGVHLADEECLNGSYDLLLRIARRLWDEIRRSRVANNANQ